MPLTKTQEEWLVGYCSDLEHDDTARSARESRDQKLADIHGRLNDLKNTVAQLESYEVIVKSRFFDKTIKSKRRDRDMDKELDLGHIKASELRDVSPETIKRVMQAHEEILKLQHEMEGMKVKSVRKLAGKDGKVQYVEEDVAAFDAKEIREELWKPLVREGVVPDNTVPDQYNETVNVFNGAAAQYDKACLRIAEQVQPWKEKSARAEYVVSKFGQITNATLGAVGPQLAHVRNAAICIQVGLEAGISVYKSYNEKKVEDGVESVGKVIEFALKPVDIFMSYQANQTGGKWEPIAKKTGGAYAAATKGYFAVKELFDDKKDKRERIFAFLEKLGAAGEGLFKCLDSKTGSANVVEGQDDSKNLFSLIGASFRQAMVTASCANKIAKALEGDPPNYGEISKALQGAAAQGLKLVYEATNYSAKAQLGDDKALIKDEITDLKEQLKDPNLDQAQKYELEQQLEAQEALKSANEAEGFRLDAEKEKGKDASTGGTSDLKNNMFGAMNRFMEDLIKDKKKMAEFSKKLNNAIEEEERKAVEKEMREELKTFTGSLAANLGMGIDPEDLETMKAAADTYAIDKLILQIEKDRALWALAEGLVNAVASTGGAVFRPLNMAMYGKDFCKNLVMAFMRQKELDDWLQMAEDAQAGASVYSNALINRVQQCRIQRNDKILNAVFEAAKLAGCATWVAAASPAGGAAVVAGVAIEYGAKAGQVLKDFIFDAYKESQLRVAWKTYKAARENKYDRVQLRKAIKTNPTFAKYVIAYGAYVEKDAFALEACRQCGLAEESLKHKDSNVGKIVQYLEVKFNEDWQLKKSITQAFRTDKGETKLELSGFISNRKSAEKKLKLKAGGTGGIEGALGAYQAAQETLAASKTSFYDKQAEYLEQKDRWLDATGQQSAATTVFQKADQNYKIALVDFRKTPEDDAILQKYNEAQAARKKTEEELKNANDALTPIDTTYKSLLEAYADTSDEGQDAVSGCQVALVELKSALKGYKPLGADDKPSTDMQAYLDEMWKLADQRLKDLDKDAKAFDVQLPRPLQTPVTDTSGTVAPPKFDVPPPLDDLGPPPPQDLPLPPQSTTSDQVSPLQEVPSQVSTSGDQIPPSIEVPTISEDGPKPTSKRKIFEALRDRASHRVKLLESIQHKDAADFREQYRILYEGTTDQSTELEYENATGLLQDLMKEMVRVLDEASNEEREKATTAADNAKKLIATAQQDPENSRAHAEAAVKESEKAWHIAQALNEAAKEPGASNEVKERAKAARKAATAARSASKKVRAEARKARKLPALGPEPKVKHQQSKETTGKPPINEDGTVDFYHEEQEPTSGHCGLHASNAFFGKNVVNLGKLSESASVQGPAKGIPEGSLPNVNDGNDPGILVDLIAEMVEDGEVPPEFEDIAISQCDANTAGAWDTFGGDRLLVGSTINGHPHFVTFRKDAGDNWWVIDSLKPKPVKILPSTYIREMDQGQDVPLTWHVISNGTA